MRERQGGGGRERAEPLFTSHVTAVGVFVYHTEREREKISKLSGDLRLSPT